VRINHKQVAKSVVNFSTFLSEQQHVKWNTSSQAENCWKPAINQSDGHSVNQIKSNQSINQSINQTIKQSINQWFISYSSQRLDWHIQMQ